VGIKAQKNTNSSPKKRGSNDSFWLIGRPDVEFVPLAKGEDQG